MVTYMRKKLFRIIILTTYFKVIDIIRALPLYK